MAPVWEALTDILGAEQLRRRRDRGEIEVAPIAFMRGRTLAHAFVIVDEAQNASRLQMKMVLTRLGEGSRMAVTGDPSQVDLVNPGRLRPRPRRLDPGGRRGRRGDALRRRRRGAPSAGGADRQGLRRRRRQAAPLTRMIDVLIEDPAWDAAEPRAAALAEIAAAAALEHERARAGDIAILLADDARRARPQRGVPRQGRADQRALLPGRRAAPKRSGDIALAFGVCAREARGTGQVAGRSPAASDGAWRPAPSGL